MLMVTKEEFASMYKRVNELFPELAKIELVGNWMYEFGNLRAVSGFTIADCCLMMNHCFLHREMTCEEAFGEEKSERGKANRK